MEKVTNKIEPLDPCLVNSRREIPFAEGTESPDLFMAKIHGKISQCQTMQDNAYCTYYVRRILLFFSSLSEAPVINARSFWLLSHRSLRLLSLFQFIFLSDVQIESLSLVNPPAH